MTSPARCTYSFRGTLVAIGITVSRYQADAQRVVIGDLWKLTGRGENEVGLPVSSERRKRAYGLPASPVASSHPRQAGHPRRRVARQSLLLASAVRPIVRRMVALDRVQERRRAVALARHYRNEEDLSIADIARRLGRAEATSRRTSTTRLMLTKGPAGNGRPSQEVASSGVTRPPRHHEETSFPDGRCSALGWLSSTAGRLGVLMLDRVTERRRAAQLARHYRDQEGLSIGEIARRLGRAEATHQGVSLRSDRR